MWATLGQVLRLNLAVTEVESEESSIWVVVTKAPPMNSMVSYTSTIAHFVALVDTNSITQSLRAGGKLPF